MAAKVNLFQEALAPGDETSYILPLALPQGLAASIHQLTPKLTQDAIEMLDRAISSWETASWQVMGPTATDLSEYVVQHWQQQQAQLQPSLSILSQKASLGGQLPSNPVRHAATWVPSTLRSAMAALFGLSATPSPQPPISGVPSTSEQQPIRPPVQSLNWADADGASIKSMPSSVQEPAPVSPSFATSAPLLGADIDGPQQVIYTTDGSIEIDINAVMVGYEKHPLERILSGLDRITAWLEGGFGKLWKWLWPKVQSYVQQVLFR